MSDVLKIPDNDDFQQRRSEARRVEPYLMRFYASISNPNALAFSEKIIESLVDQIVWPSGATARVNARFADGSPIRWSVIASEPFSRHRTLFRIPAIP